MEAPPADVIGVSYAAFLKAWSQARKNWPSPLPREQNITRLHDFLRPPDAAERQPLLVGEACLICFTCSVFRPRLTEDEYRSFGKSVSDDHPLMSGLIACGSDEALPFWTRALAVIAIGALENRDQIPSKKRIYPCFTGTVTEVGTFEPDPAFNFLCGVVRGCYVAGGTGLVMPDQLPTAFGALCAICITAPVLSSQSVGALWRLLDELQLQAQAHPTVRSLLEKIGRRAARRPVDYPRLLNETA